MCFISSIGSDIYVFKRYTVNIAYIPHALKDISIELAARMRDRVYVHLTVMYIKTAPTLDLV